MHDHIVHTCILPTSLVELREGLHPSIPTNTLHLPVDAALVTVISALYFKSGNTAPPSVRVSAVD